MPELPICGGNGCWTLSLLGQLLTACSGRRLIAAGRSAHAAIMMRREWSSELFLQNHLVNMYAKWGEMESARKVFDGVPVRNVVTWTSLISGYARCLMGERAVGVLAEMVGEGAGVRPNEYTYASVISGCGEQGLLKHGMQAHCHCLRRGFLSHTMVSNVVVTLYMAHGLVSDARMAFEEIANPDEVSWNSLISGYSQNGQLEDAVQTFWKMKNLGIPVTSVSLSSAVSSCLVDKVCGRLLHGHALKLGLDSDCFTACALLKMYSRWKETVDGWKVFEALQYKDVASWNALIDDCCGSGFDETGLHVFCDMVEFGPCIDDITIITVLGICSSLVMLVFGRLVHCLSIKTGLERKVKVENSLVNLYAKCGSLDDSMKVFSNLKDRNVISWTAMIGALALHGKVIEAMEVLEEMKRDGTKPNRTTYACILWACRHTGSIDHGKRIFQSMSIEADEEHYNCMVRLLAEGGKFDEAEQFIRNSPTKYEETLWQALLVCCKNSNEFNKGLMIAEKISRAGLHFQSPMLVLMSQIFAAAGRWDQAEELRKDMKEMGLKKEPGCSWVDLDNEFKVFGIEKQVAYL